MGFKGSKKLHIDKKKPEAHILVSSHTCFPYNFLVLISSLQTNLNRRHICLLSDIHINAEKIIRNLPPLFFFLKTWELLSPAKQKMKCNSHMQMRIHWLNATISTSVSISCLLKLNVLELNQLFQRTVFVIRGLAFLSNEKKTTAEEPICASKLSPIAVHH